jgi:phospholipase C
MVIVSPYVKPHYVDSNVASFASILAFTEHTFGLPPLGPSDANAYDYAQTFNFQQRPVPRVSLPLHPVPASSLRYMATHPRDPNDPT